MNRDSGWRDHGHKRFVGRLLVVARGSSRGVWRWRSSFGEADSLAEVLSAKRFCRRRREVGRLNRANCERRHEVLEAVHPMINFEEVRDVGEVLGGEPSIVVLSEA